MEASVDHWNRSLAHALGIELKEGHRIERFRNGREIFPAMLDAIQSAVSSIEFLFFVYWDGEIAERFCAALIERAEAGVSVRVVLDGVGSQPMPGELKRRFEASPVELDVFHPIPHWKFWSSASRTHRKILVVDGVRAFTGGVGIAEPWTGDAEDADHFRETQFQITGPAVAALRAAFLANRAAAGGALPKHFDAPPLSRPKGGAPAAVLATTGAECWTEMAILFQLLARRARHSLDIVTPYFVPGRTLADDLANASRRGVAVRVMTCGIHTDHRLSRWAGQRYYAHLLDAGVRIFEYDRTLLHTKAVIADRQLSCIGSPNMNQRSQSLDDEIAVLVHDQELADELLADFDRDLAHCRSVQQGTWRERGLLQKLRELGASLVEAQL